MHSTCMRMSPHIQATQRTKRQKDCFHPNYKIPPNRPPPQHHRYLTLKAHPPKDIDAEIIHISLPSLATLVSDPLAALISTSYVGLLGAVPLAAVGISLSLYNTATKMLNMPLLAVTTSTVATALGKSKSKSNNITTSTTTTTTSPSSSSSPPPLHLSTAISSSLIVAILTGLFELLLLQSIGMHSLPLWGAGPSSPMASDAASYLSIRAVSAPITAVFLTLQGIFRGLGQTNVPFLATVYSNIIIITLDWLFIVKLGWGVAGAALGVAAGQVVASVWLVWRLVEKELLFYHPRVNNNNTSSSSRLAKGVEKMYASRSPSVFQAAWRATLAAGRPTALLTIRTLSISGCFAFATALAARAGPEAAAAHQVAFQIWLASSLLADSLAIAAQSLVARDLAAGHAEHAVAVATRCLDLSLRLGLILALCVAALSPFLPGLFTSDPTVAGVIASIMPIIAITQPISSVAFLLDGVLYGVSGFAFAAGWMAISGGGAVVTMMLVNKMVSSSSISSGTWILGGSSQLIGIWGGLVMLMVLRVVTIVVPFLKRWKPFDQLSIVS